MDRSRHSRGKSAARWFTLESYTQMSDSRMHTSLCLEIRRVTPEREKWCAMWIARSDSYTYRGASGAAERATVVRLPNQPHWRIGIQLLQPRNSPAAYGGIPALDWGLPISQSALHARDKVATAAASASARSPRNSRDIESHLARHAALTTNKDCTVD